MATHYFLRADFVLLKTARPDRQNYRRTKAEALSCRCKVTQIGIFFPNPLHNNTLIHTQEKKTHTAAGMGGIHAHVHMLRHTRTLVK